MVAETLDRRWLAIDAVEEYLEASKFRFNGSVRRTLDTDSKSSPRQHATQGQRPTTSVKGGKRKGS
jgi:hypothetical protein